MRREEEELEERVKQTRSRVADIIKQTDAEKKEVSRPEYLRVVERPSLVDRHSKKHRAKSRKSKMVKKRRSTQAKERSSDGPRRRTRKQVLDTPSQEPLEEVLSSQPEIELKNPMIRLTTKARSRERRSANLRTSNVLSVEHDPLDYDLGALEDPFAEVQ